MRHAGIAGDTELDEDLQDVRAVDAEWQETAPLGEKPMPWEDVKRELGL